MLHHIYWLSSFTGRRWTPFAGVVELLSVWTCHSYFRRVSRLVLRIVLSGDALAFANRDI